MINPLYILAFILLLLASNCFFLIYGLRLGKAMQKDIPESQAAPVTKAAKGVFRLIRDKVHKSYLQKKADKEDENENSPYN
jgi:hypothetical protein